MNSNRIRWSTLLGDVFLIVQLILVCSAIRLLCQDIPNFAPIASMALFAGLWVRNRALALAAPLGAMMLSDRLLGQSTYEPALMLIVYLSLALPAFLAPQLKRASARIWNHSTESNSAPSMRARIARVCGITTLGLIFVLTGSLCFFFASNLGVWWYWYERDFAGLVQCFTAALPFLRFTILGDLSFAAVFACVHAFAFAMANQRSKVVESADAIA